MAQMYECFECSGTGQVDGETCQRCMGSGELRADWIKIGILGREALQEKIDNIEDKVTDILDKCNDIFEQVSGP